MGAMKQKMFDDFAYEADAERRDLIALIHGPAIFTHLNAQIGADPQFYGFVEAHFRWYAECDGWRDAEENAMQWLIDRIIAELMPMDSYEVADLLPLARHLMQENPHAAT